MDHTDTSLSNKSSLKKLLSDLIKICSPAAGKSAHQQQENLLTYGKSVKSLRDAAPLLSITILRA